MQPAEHDESSQLWEVHCMFPTELKEGATSSLPPTPLRSAPGRDGLGDKLSSSEVLLPWYVRF